MDINYIESNQALALACDTLKTSLFICIDTEFHRETTYYPELALIQISDGETTYCIDPLDITDFSGFTDLLNNIKIIKVLHASQQDMEIFNYKFNTLPSPVFDTQIAAGLLGYGDQIGYAGLIKKELNIDIDKSQTRTDWMKRPLSQQQLEYAANDVYYLAKAYPKIVNQLTSLNRLEWLENDFTILSSPEKYCVDSQTIWKKVKGNAKVHGLQLAILQALAAWREKRAQQKNRPRRRIVPDDALIDIARQQLNKAEQICSLRSLNKTRLSTDDANELLQCIDATKKLAREQWPQHIKRHKSSMRDEALIDALSSIIKLKADEHKITPLNLASKKDLEALLNNQTNIPLMQGWRYSHAGQSVEAFLKGDSLLQASTDGLKNIENNHE